MRQLTIQKNLFLSFAILTATLFSSCSSVGPNSDQLIGEWVRQYSSYTKGENYGTVQSSGFNISWETTWVLNKGGDGKVVNKTINVWDDKSMGNTSRTIEYPIKWETKKNGTEGYLIMKYGAGKITDIQADNKLKEEQEATTSMNIFNGLTDTTYFKIQPDKTISWHVKNSTEEYKMAKR